MRKTVFFNAHIIAASQAAPANYIAVQEGKIEDIGTLDSASLWRKYPQAKRIDLRGKTVIPGLIDSHMHLLTGALTKLQIDLSHRRFPDMGQMLEYLRQQAVGAGQAGGKMQAEGAGGWVRAFGFDEVLTGENRLPKREELDRYFPDRPIIITRVCGHLSLLNSQALSRLDEAEMRSVCGGEFQTDACGRFTGVATEGAQQYVLDRIPAPPADQVLAILKEEQQALFRLGICSIHDAGTDQLSVKDYVGLYKAFADSGSLKLRTCLMVRPVPGMEEEAFFSYVAQLKREHPPERSRLFFGAVKLFADGSIGGRTAALCRGYRGQPENRGLLLLESLKTYIAAAHRHRLAVAVHAIGDRAAEETANRMIAAMRKDGVYIRHRIEHAELQHERLMEKIAQNGLCVMTQPGFIGEFQQSYRNNLGEDEALRIQPLKTMLRRGICVGFGTDYPVISPSPALGIESAITRREREGRAVLNPGERISFQEALRCYTENNAYAAGTEALQGSLRTGSFADFVVLGERWEELCDGFAGFTVLRTVIGGETVYQGAGGSLPDGAVQLRNDEKEGEA